MPTGLGHANLRHIHMFLFISPTLLLLFFYSSLTDTLGGFVIHVHRVGRREFLFLTTDTPAVRIFIFDDRHGRGIFFYF